MKGGYSVKRKNFIIGLIIIALGATIAICGSAYSNYKFRVNDILEYSIYANLNMTQQELINLKNEFKKHEGSRMSEEEFHNIIHEALRNYFLYGDYTSKFQQVDKKYSDIDYSDLNGYFLLLNEQIPSEQVEYHHENLMKIINLWASQNFNAMDNYLEVREDLKKLIEETDRLANDGMKQIEETL